MNKTLYYIVFFLWKSVSKMPAFIHYGFSTVLSTLLFYVVRYRRKVVRRNIKESFPELSELERFRIERRFYLHFCDILVESVMFFGMTEKQLRRRMKFKGLELLQQSAANGKSVGVFLGHYGNWEWMTALPIHVKDYLQLCQIYHPLENPTMNEIIKTNRSRFGAVNITVKESLRGIMKESKEHCVMVGFLGDQVPMWNNIHLWIPFLNHPETPVFTGAERIVRKLNMDAYYLDVVQTSRGHYECEFKLITDQSRECPENYITIEYSRFLEETIRRNPPLWLWSHNRWKRTKAEWLKMLDPETGRVYMK